MVTSIIPHNRVLGTPPYTAYHLPALVPGTAGVAIPKAGASAVVCIAPGDATATNPNFDQQLDIHTGDPHQAIAADDTYPNQVFTRDCSIKGVAESNDPRTRALREFWESKGYNDDALREAWVRFLEAKFPNKKRRPSWWKAVRSEVGKGRTFFVAKKDREAIVLGVVDLRMMTSEGPTGLVHGSVLLQHPDDPSNQWTSRPEKFASRYDWKQAPRSGLLIPRV